MTSNTLSDGRRKQQPKGSTHETNPGPGTGSGAPPDPNISERRPSPGNRTGTRRLLPVDSQEQKLNDREQKLNDREQKLKQAQSEPASLQGSLEWYHPSSIVWTTKLALPANFAENVNGAIDLIRNSDFDDRPAAKTRALNEALRMTCNTLSAISPRALGERIDEIKFHADRSNDTWPEVVFGDDVNFMGFLEVFERGVMRSVGLSEKSIQTINAQLAKAREVARVRARDINGKSAQDSFVELKNGVCVAAAAARELEAEDERRQKRHKVIKGVVLGVATANMPPLTNSMQLPDIFPITLWAASAVIHLAAAFHDD